MRHGRKKIILQGGYDGSRSIVRKLALNFIKHGSVETTVNRARVLKSVMDRLTYKAQLARESDKNVLLSYLGQKQTVDLLTKKIAPQFKTRNTGFVKLIRTRIRKGDAASLAKVQWVKPIKIDPSVSLRTRSGKQKVSDKEPVAAKVHEKISSQKAKSSEVKK